MLKIIRENRLDIIIEYSMTNGFIGLLLAKLFNIPYIFHYIYSLHKLVFLLYTQNIARICSRISLKYADQDIIYTKLERTYVIY